MSPFSLLFLRAVFLFLRTAFLFLRTVFCFARRRSVSSSGVLFPAPAPLQFGAHNWAATSDAQRGVILELWRKSRNELTSPRASWNAARGPMGALVRSLVRLQWGTPRPDLWTSRDRFGQVVHSIGSCATVIASAEQSARSILAQRQAQHWCATCAQHLTCFDVVRQHVARLRDKSEFRRANAVLRIATGSLWAQERRQRSGMPVSGHCLRCNGAVDTAFHTLWECFAKESSIAVPPAPRAWANKLLVSMRLTPFCGSEVCRPRGTSRSPCLRSQHRSCSSVTSWRCRRSTAPPRGSLMAQADANPATIGCVGPGGLGASLRPEITRRSSWRVGRALKESVKRFPG